MIVTIEISMYPLKDNYIKSIDDFIRSLYDYPFKVTSNYTSTHVIGEYEVVMDALQKEMKNALLKDKSSFVFKVLAGDLSKDVDLDDLR